MSIEIRICAYNVGKITGKGRKLVDRMQRRKVDVFHVQETMLRGCKSRNIGEGFKMFYDCVDKKKNRIGQRNRAGKDAQLVWVIKAKTYCG